MTPTAILITRPSIDFGTFLGLSQQILGYSPSETVDASPIELSDAQRFLECLASLKDRKTQGFTPHLLTHVSFSVLAAADDRDMLDILQTASSMPFVVTDTRVRGVQLSVISGTLAQWQDAVVSGSSRGSQLNVRTFFNRVMRLFEEVGLNVWKDFDNYPLQDCTFYLEEKRK
jgi:hypothetical protein